MRVLASLLFVSLSTAAMACATSTPSSGDPTREPNEAESTRAESSPAANQPEDDQRSAENGGSDGDSDDAVPNGVEQSEDASDADGLVRVPDDDKHPIGGPQNNCLPRNPCRGKSGEGGPCGTVSAGCPGVSVACQCQKGLFCHNGNCTTRENLPSLEDVEIDQETASTIESSFETCEDGKRVGQSKKVSGITCAQICAHYGFKRCLEREPQDDFNVCNKPQAVGEGSCTDSIQEDWHVICSCE